MPRFLYVVARDRRDLLERLRAEFAHQHDVAVIMDRRSGERRQDPTGHPVDLRRGERRTQPELDADLRVSGAFITACADVMLVVVR
jgi:hypothetical protein